MDSAVSPGCEKWRVVVSSSSVPLMVTSVEVPACRPWGKIVFRSGEGSWACRMVEHAIVNAKRVKRRKGDTGVASVVEEKLLCVEKGPDEVFVGLSGGEEWVRRRGLVTFLGLCRQSLGLFFLQVGEGGSEFVRLGRAGKGVEVELGEKGFRLRILLFCEMGRT